MSYSNTSALDGCDGAGNLSSTETKYTRFKVFKLLYCNDSFLRNGWE